VTGQAQALAAVASAQTVALIALGVGLARTRERLIRLEEWVRVHERRLNGETA
jgi:hypothetical protein